MAATPFERWIRRLGFAAGLTAAALTLASWQTPGAAERSRVELGLRVNPTGQVDVRPSGRVLKVRSLAPGRSARIAVRLRNLTAETLAVRLRGAVASHDLDDVLHVRLAAGRRELYRGSLGRLRPWTPRALPLAAGGGRRLAVTLSIPRSAPGSLVGAGGELSLELSARRRS
jgi:hypothetical protein